MCFQLKQELSTSFTCRLGCLSWLYTNHRREQTISLTKVFCSGGREHRLAYFVSLDSTDDRRSISSSGQYSCILHSNTVFLSVEYLMEFFIYEINREIQKVQHSGYFRSLPNHSRITDLPSPQLFSFCQYGTCRSYCHADHLFTTYKIHLFW